MKPRKPRKRDRNNEKNPKLDNLQDLFADNSNSIRRPDSIPKARATTYDAGNKDESVAAIRFDKDDAKVWEQPGFDKYEFYAAAQYLQKHEKNQGFYKSNDTQGSAIRSGLPTDKVACEMLDCLALLFARVKNRTSPEHVTATALKRTEGCVEIWIAKNHGP
jgi:hypothetical protein